MPSDTYTLTISDFGVSTPSTGSVVNASVDANAAIAFSKLATLASGNILVGSSGNVPTSVAVTGDVTVSNTGVAAIASGVIVNADVNASAAIAHSKLASLTSGNLLVGNSSNVPTSVAVTGDVTISNTGVTSIGSGVITNADISAAAQIEFSKLATLASGNIIVGSSGGGPTSVAVTGDITISNTGVTSLRTSPTLVTPILGIPAAGSILTNCTGLPISTGVSGLGTGVANFLATPSSANLDALVTDDTGSGVLVFSNSPTLVSPNIGSAFGTSLSVSGAITSYGTAGIGYSAGAGGTITQGSSKTNPVSLHNPCGQITMDDSTLAQYAVATFTLNNSTITLGDVLILNHVSSGTAGKYSLNAQCGSGSASINVTNISSGSLSEAIVIAFVVIKASVLEV